MEYGIWNMEYGIWNEMDMELNGSLYTYYPIAENAPSFLSYQQCSALSR